MIDVTLIPERVEPRRWTRQEYEQLASMSFFDSEERLELIDGEIFRMSPQSTWHATATGKANEVRRKLYPHGHHTRVQMPFAADEQSIPEPDVALVVGDVGEYRDAHPSTAVIIVEVADSSLTHDRERKRRLYARAGVPEYWLINLSDYCLEVFRNPAREKYQFHLILAPAETIAPLTQPHHSITVSELLP